MIIFCFSITFQHFFQQNQDLFFYSATKTYICNELYLKRMLPAIFGFLDLSVADIIDIIIVALLIFVVFRWMRNSSATNIIVAILFIYVLMVLAEAFNMKMVRSLLGTFIDVGVLALIIIFQPEIRHFLSRIGSETKIGSTGGAFMAKLFGKKEDKMDSEAVNEVAEACRTMSDEKTGALIVFPHKDSLDYIIETGDIVDAAITRRLILGIFFKNSPMHDGAMIIQGNRVWAARCTLPITSRTNLPASYGMRHKAAVGISEECDADVIVVSEETGRVSFVRGGEVTRIKNMNELKLKLGAAIATDKQTNSDNE